MNKILCVMWCIAAFTNLLAFLTGGFDFDKALIASLEALLAWDRYEDWKREGA